MKNHFLMMVLLSILISCNGISNLPKVTSSAPVETVNSKAESLLKVCTPPNNPNYQTANFYVDSVKGDDSFVGSSERPWKTISKALKLTSEAVVFVREGVYQINESIPVAKSGMVTLVAIGNVKPVIEGVRFSYTARSSAKVRLVGFTIKGVTNTGGPIVNLSNVIDAEILNSNIFAKKYVAVSATPGQPYQFVGISVSKSDGVLIKDSCITKVARGVQITESNNVKLLRNYISPQASSAIQHLKNNTNVYIEENHIRGDEYVPYPDDPEAIFDPHASIVSIRSGSLYIRNNIMHGMGSSSGIMFYTPDAAGGMDEITGYSDIHIDGNLIYDIHNYYVIRMYNAANNISVRNNTIIARHRLSANTCDGISADARWRYDTAVAVHTLANGYTGSAISFANNIIIGSVALPPAIAEKNNIIWSYRGMSDFTYLVNSPSGTSKIVTSTAGSCGNHNTYFEKDFFSGPTNFAPSHGENLPFVPLPSSDAIGFGDQNLKYEKVLGLLDSNGYFLLPGRVRSLNEHSAGAYEL